MTAADRVAAIRLLMREHSLDAFVVPSEDAHMSEYVAECHERRAFLSAFTGSAGTALVTLDKALLWTDGRYFVQAGIELDPTVFQMKKTYEDPGVEDWLVDNMPPGSKVAVDGMTVSINGMKRFQTAIKEAAASTPITVVSLPEGVENLVDTVWGSARPAVPASNIFVHSVRHAGMSAKEKLVLVRESMKKKGATLHVVAGLDEVAWLLNLRGSDVEFNPVFLSYVIVKSDSATLYVNSTRFGEGVAEHLKEADVDVASYDALTKDLQNYCWDDKSCVWLDINICNYSILECIEKASPGVSIVKKAGPVPLAKARKCKTELDGVRESHIRDGVALSKFLYWLENEVVNVGNEPTECEAADKLDGLRSEQDLFVSLSFPTISSAGANAAIIHYRPEVGKCANITKDGVYLVDSGGQYRDGTTDVTRTVHFGTPTDWEKECFTRVLQGHIAIDKVIFPKGTTGHLLDSFARKSLWQAGIDYKHGTGHGVGSFLNVHEGPHVISFKPQAQGTPLEPGFLTSNEPGYYEENGFGIRIENVCIVVNAGVKGPPTGAKKPYYKMERVTQAPIQAKMIDTKLLSADERAWVDSYHVEIFEKLSPLLKEDKKTLEWLRVNTEPLKA